MSNLRLAATALEETFAAAGLAAELSTPGPGGLSSFTWSGQGHSTGVVGVVSVGQKVSLAMDVVWTQKRLKKLCLSLGSRSCEPKSPSRWDRLIRPAAAGGREHTKPMWKRGTV